MPQRSQANLKHGAILPLEVLRPGEWGDIAEISGEPSWVGRMAELGVRAGARLRVLQRGSPCLLQVGNSRLSVRHDLGTRILVQLVPALA
jgi:ferrous iron transport protein A